MRVRFLKKLKKIKASPTLVGDDSGATMVEFALVAPFALIMIMAIVELSLMMLAQNVMESATFVASRSGMTGYVTAGKTREQSIRDILDARAGTFLKVANVSITSKIYSKFSKIGEPEPFIDANGNGNRDNGENYTDVNGNGQFDEDQGTNGNGASGSIVVYNVTYPWKIFTPVIGQMMGLTNGAITLSSRVVVKNEPYAVN